VRNNALPSHVRAKPAAIAAVAAAKQGKYWDYYDKLWAKIGARSDLDLERMAMAAGLDVPRWKADLADPGSAARVQAESDAAVRLGASGTPALFVNGVRQVGWGSYRDLHDKVAREIAATDPLIQGGTPARSVAEARIRQSADRNQKRDGEAAPDLDDWVKVLLAP
jgi:protein-disulfide isomerase